MPDALLVAVAGEIVEVPLPWSSETPFPATPFPLTSFNVTVTVAVVLPSATSEPGVATTVELPASVTSGVNVTFAVCVTATESSVSVAAYVTLSATVLEAEKVATPEALVFALPGEIEEEPAPCASVTALPATGLLCASLSVTVIVELADPFALTDVGDAETVEFAAVTAPGVNATSAVCVIVVESSVSVAVYVTV